MTSLGIALGGRLETFAGLAGMGDLVLTCTGSLSRNRTVGVQLGKGKSSHDILGDMRAVAEGSRPRSRRSNSPSATASRCRSRGNASRALRRRVAARSAIQRLMTRALKSEVA